MLSPARDLGILRVVAFVEAYLRREQTFIHRQMMSVPSCEMAFVARYRVPGHPYPEERVSFFGSGTGPPRTWWSRKWLRTRQRVTGRLAQLSHSESERLVGILARSNPDLVHAHWANEAMTVAPVCSRLAIPLLVHFHGYDVSWMTEDSVYTRNLPGLFTQMRLAITVSAEMRDRVIALGCPPQKVVTHYTGVPADYFSERSRPAGRVILQVGRFVPFKGHDTALRAVALARRQLPDLKLRLVGDGPLRPTLEKLITDLGLSESVELLGWLPPTQVAAELRGAFALVHPSRTSSGDIEGLPNAVVEALAAGLPVVATYHAGVPEAVSYSEPGWLLGEADAEGMAARIVRLASDTHLWDRLSREGSALARSRFHLSTQNQRLRELYERVR